MNNIVLYDADGTKVLIESSLPSSGGKFVSRVDGITIVEAANTLERSFAPVMAFTKKMIDSIESFKIEKPGKVELELGLKLSGAVDFWVISGAGEGNINLKLTWEMQPATNNGNG